MQGSVCGYKGEGREVRGGVVVVIIVLGIMTIYSFFSLDILSRVSNSPLGGSGT